MSNHGIVAATGTRPGKHSSVKLSNHGIVAATEDRPGKRRPCELLRQENCFPTKTRAEPRDHKLNRIEILK